MQCAFPDRVRASVSTTRQHAVRRARPSPAFRPLTQSLRCSLHSRHPLAWRQDSERQLAKLHLLFRLATPSALVLTVLDPHQAPRGCEVDPDGLVSREFFSCHLGAAAPRPRPPRRFGILAGPGPSLRFDLQGVYRYRRAFAQLRDTGLGRNASTLHPHRACLPYPTCTAGAVADLPPVTRDRVCRYVLSHYSLPTFRGTAWPLCKSHLAPSASWVPSPLHCRAPPLVGTSGVIPSWEAPPGMAASTTHRTAFTKSRHYYFCPVATGAKNSILIGKHGPQPSVTQSF